MYDVAPAARYRRVSAQTFSESPNQSPNHNRIEMARDDVSPSLLPRTWSGSRPPLTNASELKSHEMKHSADVYKTCKSHGCGLTSTHATFPVCRVAWPTAHRSVHSLERTRPTCLLQGLQISKSMAAAVLVTSAQWVGVLHARRRLDRATVVARPNLIRFHRITLLPELSE